LAIGREQAVLAVLAEHPQARGNTRLSAHIGARFDAEFVRAVIEDTAERFDRTTAACSLLWCVPDPAAFGEIGVAGPVAAVPAGRGGERRTLAVAAAHERGFSHVAVIGLDAPHIANDAIYGALGQADQYGVVFGAGDRGSLYLVATKTSGEVFRDVRFETDDAATDLIVQAGLHDLSCAPLVGNFVVRDGGDIDRLADYFGRRKNVESHRTRDVVARILAARKIAGDGGTKG
jgi:glycosyltransferase A (GT-A) superfamily protein (DUF2064 family)